MRTLTAALIAVVVLLTLTRVSTHKSAILAEQIAYGRNMAAIAAYAMLYANCTNVYDVLRDVNATKPLPDAPTGLVVVWCGDAPRLVPFSWRG